MATGLTSLETLILHASPGSQQLPRNPAAGSAACRVGSGTAGSGTEVQAGSGSQDGTAAPMAAQSRGMRSPRAEIVPGDDRSVTALRRQPRQDGDCGDSPGWWLGVAALGAAGAGVCPPRMLPRCSGCHERSEREALIYNLCNTLLNRLRTEISVALGERCSSPPRQPAAATHSNGISVPARGRPCCRPRHRPVWGERI